MSNTILNTRPLLQSEQTALAFKKQGLKVINFPCIEIVPVDKAQLPSKQLSEINSNDVIIFTSVNAVYYLFKLNPSFELHNKTTVIAVGEKTAQLLEQHLNSDIWIPEQQNSLGVIELLKGIKNLQSIKLISAKNGRDEIQQFAININVRLIQINVYKRQLPTVNPATLEAIKNSTDLIIIATSTTTLNNLKLLVDNNSWKKLVNRPLFCASKRIEIYSKKLGFNQTININTANPQIMAKKISDFLLNI